MKSRGARIRSLVTVPAALAVATALLTGCSALWDGPPADPIFETTVDPTTAPAFLETPQRDDDVLPTGTPMSAGPASIRYQGRWDGRDFYLGTVGGEGSPRVVLVNVSVADDGISGEGSSDGNTVLGAERSGTERDGLVYLPQGTRDLPDGWRPLSDWVAVED